MLAILKQSINNLQTQNHNSNNMPKAKTRGGISKKIKITNGGDTKKGKMMIGVIGRCHRMIKKRRVTVLAGKKRSSLAPAHDRYKSMLSI
jgi:ribosomal protein L35